jgi:hypothetical protein
MQAESLEVLENASVAPAQARAIVRAIEIELAAAKDTLATKHDLLALRGEVHQLGADLRGETAALAATLRTEIAKQGADLRSEMHRTLSTYARQMYVALLGQTTVLLGFFYFFFIQLR